MTKDLMYKDEIQQLVVGAYRQLTVPGGPGTGFYSEPELAALPRESRDWALGVGNPLGYASLDAGDTVVDVGCGAGVDVLLAAPRVGPAGRVVGVDLLGEMLGRAHRFAAEAGAANVSFCQAEMEALPLPDASVDVVVSNGAVNLSARKSRVLAEAWRILRPGGRLCVSDLTIREEELPPEVLTHPSAWAG